MQRRVWCQEQWLQIEWSSKEDKESQSYLNETEIALKHW